MFLKTFVSCFQSSISQRTLTFDCHTSLYGWEWFNDSITLWTVAATSWGYGSPLSTTYKCITWPTLRKFACMYCRTWITCQHNQFVKIDGVPTVFTRYWNLIWNMLKICVSVKVQSSAYAHITFYDHSLQRHQPHKKALEPLVSYCISFFWTNNHAISKINEKIIHACMNVHTGQISPSSSVRQCQCVLIHWVYKDFDYTVETTDLLCLNSIFLYLHGKGMGRKQNNHIILNLSRKLGQLGLDILCKSLRLKKIVII